ncbi:MAG: hypothetical protein ACI89J_003336 [Hyphomicrobiaceae bacterium]|jgi:hypothetical protein
MSNILNEESDHSLIAAERKASYLFRQLMNGGNRVLTAGIVTLGGETRVSILHAVRTLEDFDCSDASDDHSIGDVEITVTPPGVEPHVVLVFFKLTRSGLDGKAVLTLSLADEWWTCRDVSGPCFREVAR